MAGGAAGKAGNRYERLWTALKLLDVVAGDAEYLELEVLGEDGHGAEFCLLKGGTRQWHQVKRQHSRGNWTIANLRAAGVLASWWPRLRDGEHCVFVSTTSAQELDELAHRARVAQSFMQFDTVLLAPRSQREPFERLCRAWGATAETAYQALTNIEVHAIGEADLGKQIQDRLAALVGEPASIAAAVLEKIVDDSTHLRLTAADVWERLAAEGIQRKSVGSRSLGATGNQQVVNQSNGHVLQVTGDSNIISLYSEQPERKWSFSRVAAIIAALSLVSAVAAYFVFRGSGTPAYFQTGPAAGIAATPAGQCPAVAQFPSPGAFEFRDVSLVHSFSLDGRSAFEMQGEHSRSEYYWVVSDPNGNLGGMQLRWPLNGVYQYCTVSIPVTSLSKQVSTVAVPDTINGAQVSFRACVWYDHGNQEDCWPRR